ncbi:hypothetical protein GEMRC1_014171 [Eukaryota sp. GEM-RC1]
MDPISALSTLLHQPDALIEQLKHLLQSTVEQSAHKALLSDLVQLLSQQSPDTISLVAPALLNFLNNYVANYPDPVIQLAEIFATTLYTEGDIAGACKALRQLSIDLLPTPSQKAHILLSITQLYLQLEDYASADQTLRRCAPHVHNTHDRSFWLKFKGCQAQVHDYNRNFITATQCYLVVAQEDEDRSVVTTAIQSGLITALLSPAGPKRNTLLSQITNHPEAKECPLYHVAIKALTPRTLNKDDVTFVASFLSPHHLAVSADGVTTVLDSSMIQHNLSVISIYYESIRIASLCNAVNVESEDVIVDILTRMVRDKRLDAVIDLALGVVVLRKDESVDSRLVGLFGNVNKACDLIGTS